MPFGLPQNSGRAFARSERAASAVEFAVAFPVLLCLMLAGTQLIAYVNAVRKVEQLASSISEMMSQAAPPNNSTTVAKVNALDVHFSYDSALVIFPYLMRDAANQGVAWWQDIQISFASIQFTPLPTPCGATSDKSSCYTANVVWTSTLGSNLRPCLIPQTAANDSAPPSNTTLPRSVFGAGSLIVIDVVFLFKPTFGSTLMNPLRIARSVYVQPRYASLITYDMTTSDGIATTCLGF